MKKIYKVKDMNCNSCAQIIELALKGKVNSVKVSYSKEEAEIDFNPEKISEDEIRKIVKNKGYELESKGDKEESDKSGWYILAGVIVVSVIILYYLFFIKLGYSFPEINVPNVGEKTSLILLFAAGLLTGFHCISMCGGFVVSYAAKNAARGHKSFKQHLVYGAAKVASYAIIGGIFGLVGGVIAFNLKLRGAIAILAGLLMVAYALSMFGVGFFKKFHFNPKFLSKIAIRSEERR